VARQQYPPGEEKLLGWSTFLNFDRLQILLVPIPAALSCAVG